MQQQETEKSQEFRGVLDWMDIILGRLSSRTNPDGTRIRSWGITFCFWMTAPSIVFMLTYGGAVLIVSTSTRNHVPRKLVALYVACVQKAEKAGKRSNTCVIPKADSGSKLSPKALDIGKWPFIMAMFFPLLGFIGMIMRNKDDLNAFKALLDTAREFAAKGGSVPNEIMDAIRNQGAKVTGGKIERTPRKRGARGEAPAVTNPPPGQVPGLGGPPPGAVDDAGM